MRHVVYICGEADSGILGRTLCEELGYEFMNTNSDDRIPLDLFKGEHSGHDFWHSMRVYQNAMRIAWGETCDREVVALAALLHDVDDTKLFETRDYANARKMLKECGIDGDRAENVITVYLFWEKWNQSAGNAGGKNRSGCGPIGCHWSAGDCQGLCFWRKQRENDV